MYSVDIHNLGSREANFFLHFLSNTFGEQNAALAKSFFQFVPEWNFPFTELLQYAAQQQHKI